MIFADLTREQRAWQLRVLFATYMGYAGYYLTRKVFGVVKAPLADSFGWELADTAHIWTAFLVAYMVGQFVNSFIGRKYGPRVILLGGLGLSILCNLVFGFANSYATFMIFMVFNGLLQASGWPGVVGGVSQWLHPKERGAIIGVWASSYMVGNIMTKSLASVLLGVGALWIGEEFSWRFSFFGCTICAVLIWWLIYFWQRDTPEDAGVEAVLDADHEEELQAVSEAQGDDVSFKEYVRLAFHPVVLTIGLSYFFVKFMRYALDSWMPAFLNLQGIDAASAGFYSTIFDWAGLVGAASAGFMLRKIFRGNWAALCLAMALGMVGGYLAVIYLGTTPERIALCFGIVGFMLYGPDVMLSGQAAVEVAGTRNGVAIAGLVNGLGSIGPVVQEEVIGYITKTSDDPMTAMARLLLTMSVIFCFCMAIMIWRLHKARLAHQNQLTAGEAVE